MHNKRQCLIVIFLKSQKGRQISRKRGQKGGLGGQGPKRRVKGGHGSALPPPKKRAVRQLCQELSIEYHRDYFWTKINNTTFLGHIWAWAWGGGGANDPVRSYACTHYLLI